MPDTSSQDAAPEAAAESRAGRVVYRLGRARRDLLAALLQRVGWSCAVLPYPGYGASGRVRLLARVVLAPPGREPSAVRGVAAWRRLVTLQRSRVTVDVASSTGEVTHRVQSGPGGFIDATVPWELEPGPSTVTFAVSGRPPVEAVVHVADPSARRGIVCDIDDTALITGLRHPLRAAWTTVSRAFARRLPVEGVADLLSAARAEQAGDHSPVVYLSNGPWNFTGPLARFLARCSFPAGPLLLTQWSPTAHGLFRDGSAHKARSLQRLRSDFPAVRWLLVGDDGEHDPAVYSHFAREHPQHVLAIALRQVSGPTGAGGVTGAGGADEGVGRRPPVPVVHGPDGHVLLQRLRDAGVVGGG